MFQPRTLKFFAATVAMFLLLTLPALVWPSYLDSPVGLIVAIPYLSIYLFHKIGIPGLLENNGLCGWGWCAPSTFGWIFLFTFWLLIAWLLALGISSLSHHSNQRLKGD